MKRRTVTLAAMALAVTAAAATRQSEETPRFVWNVSGSVPTGLYRVRPARDLTVATLVVAYPPKALATWLADGGYLPMGLPLIKPVLALNGQTVCRSGTIITVDGRAVGAAQERDHSGRPLPVWQGCRVISAGEIFLMNPDASASLDGRYFGPIPITAIAGVADPLWTSADGLDASPAPAGSPARPRFDEAATRLKTSLCLPSASSSR